MDLHDAFRRWLISGQSGTLPRDVALHASACPECMRATAAFDGLSTIDPAAAPEPPVIGDLTPPRTRTLPGWLVPAGASVVLGILTVSAIALNLSLDSRSLAAAAPPSATASAAATPAGEVLGDQRSPRASATATPTETPEASAAGASATPGAASTPGATGPRPTFQGTPLPTAVPTTTSAPSASASASGSASATASPTPTASQATPPPPTATATPTPTPAPAPACSNTLDDDEDGLIDGADPGCTSPDDDDETDPPAP